jgi:hypothetical protein
MPSLAYIGEVSVEFSRDKDGKKHIDNEKNDGKSV